MPIFANDVLRVGVKGLGALMSSAGLGALIAALLLARLGDFEHKGRLLIVSSFVFSLALILFALSKVYALSLAALACVGWASVTAVSLINTLLQQLVPDGFRGRVMSLFMLTFAGVVPFGNLFAGMVAHVWGVSLTVAASGFICAAFFTVIYSVYPDIQGL